MKRIVTALIVLILAGNSYGSHLENAEFPLPFDINPKAVKPLRECMDQALQKRLETMLFTNRSWKKMILKKKMTIGLVDLTKPSNILFAAVNGDEMMYAASLPKLAILLTAFHCFENGLLEQTPEIMKDLTLMIRK